MLDLIQPKSVAVEGIGGVKKQFNVSKLPATVGREVLAKYPLSSMPKIGDYGLNEETMIKMIGYVEVVNDQNKTRLATKELIDNHVPDWEMLAKLELEMLEYNTSFFVRGKVSKLLSKFEKKAPQLIIKTLTGLLQQLSQQEKPASKS